MVDIDKIIETHLSETGRIPWRLAEMSGANISRVLTHLQDRNYAFMSAFRFAASDEENNKNHKDLKNLLKRLYYSWINLEGHWVYDKTGEKIKEKSLMILAIDAPDESLENFETIMVRLMHAYNQEAILIKKAGGNPREYSNNGNIRELCGLTLTLQNIEKLFQK